MQTPALQVEPPVQVTPVQALVGVQTPETRLWPVGQTQFPESQVEPPVQVTPVQASSWPQTPLLKD